MAEQIERLPRAFLEEMEGLLGEEEMAQYLASFDREWNRGLRVNEKKISGETFFQRHQGMHGLKKVPWIGNGYWYDSSWTASKDADYYAGLYYLQEPSAMTPASLLPVKPGDRVLDLCAAPGGKATELGVKLKGEGILFANDISHSRSMALLKNLELFGITNSCVTSEAPERLAEALPGFFTKILVDAPCSGEGMFRREPGMVTDWMERGPEYYCPLQRKILLEAVKLLAPGGLLLYSTCTFSVRENEENITFLCGEEKEMEVVPLPLFPGAAGGFGVLGVLRLFPHRIGGEGHFIALLRKKNKGEGSEEKQEGGERQEYRPKNNAWNLAAERPRQRTGKTRMEKDERLDGDLGKEKKGEGQAFGDWEAFKKDLRVKFEPSRIRLLQGRMYYLPEEFPEGVRLRFLRTGLLLGEVKNGRFEPGQALAMCLREDEFKRTICFLRGDERVVRYLKGETVTLKEDEGERKGWCLVCLEGGFPLGWAKGMGNVLKNKYCAGWRFLG